MNVNMQFKPRFSANQEAFCIIKIDDASCIAVNTHFVFDWTTTYRIAFAKWTIFIQVEFWYDK